MTFKQAAEGTPGLSDAYRPGLQALSKADRNRIVCANPRRCTGSVDLDHALAIPMPNEPRWDYGAGLRQDHSEKVVWIEVHPACSNHVDEVLAKLAWLKKWLHANAPLLNALPRSFVWIASGQVSLQRHSPQRRKVAARGLQFAGSRLSLA